MSLEGSSSLSKAEELLKRVEDVRQRLEGTPDEDADTAIELLEQLAELTKDVQAELERARREADAAGS
jgi:hypothetical protein